MTGAAYLLNGFALKLLWGWFIVTTFSLPFLSFWQAVGVCVTISFLTAGGYTKMDDEDLVMGIIFGFLRPVCAITFGWIFHLFL